MSSFIKLHRKVTEWEWFTKGDTFKVFFYLVTKANWKRTTWRGVILERGQLPCGLKAIAAGTGVSIQAIRTILKRLESTSELTRKSTPNFSVITICNYDKYQGFQEDDQQPNQHTDQHTDQQHLKKVKKVKNKDMLSEAPSNGSIPYSKIISHLNTVVGTDFKATTRTTKGHIKARWNEGFRLDDFIAVIDSKADEWLVDEKMNEYLRPPTLFGTKFESYRQAAGVRNITKRKWHVK